MTTPVLFRNKSATPCYLEGYPGITVVDASGHSLAVATGSANRGTYFDNGNSWVVAILMKTGTASFSSTAMSGTAVQGQAWINVEWFVCSHPPAASRMIIDLPSSGGRLSISYPVRAAWNGSCVAGATAGLSRGQFTPTGIDGWPPSGSYLSDRISIQAPAPLVPGTTFIYYVTIANISDKDYVLDPCPNYIEFLGAKQAVAEYRLNCEPIGLIASGSSATFQVRLTVPPSLPSGRTTITWVVMDGGLATQSASASVVVS